MAKELKLIYFITSDDQIQKDGDPPPSWSVAEFNIPASNTPEIRSSIRIEEIDKTCDVRAFERKYDEPDVITIFLDVQGGLSESDITILRMKGWCITPKS